MRAVAVRCPGEEKRNVYAHASHSCRNGTRVSLTYATATFACGAWEVTSTVQPVARYVSGAIRNLDLKVVGPPLGAHGILGQNLDRSRSRGGKTDAYPSSGEYVTMAQAEGAIAGTHLDYVVQSSHSTDFKHSAYKRTAVRQQRVGMVFTHD